MRFLVGGDGLNCALKWSAVLFGKLAGGCEAVSGLDSRVAESLLEDHGERGAIDKIPQRR